MSVEISYTLMIQSTPFFITFFHQSRSKNNNEKRIKNRITRSAITVEINTEDVKVVKTNISSLHSKRHLQSIFLFT